MMVAFPLPWRPSRSIGTWESSFTARQANQRRPGSSGAHSGTNSEECFGLGAGAVDQIEEDQLTQEMDVERIYEVASDSEGRLRGAI